MQARDIMTKAPVACVLSTSLQEVAQLLLETDCGALPVIDLATRRPLGVITDRDIVCRSLALGRDPLKLTARDCMTGPCITVLPGTPLGDCCDTMEGNRIRRLVVVDEDGACCGMLTQADLAQGAPERLTAEVVREISLSAQVLNATF